VNRRRAALCQFGRWLVRERRTAWDPFIGLSALNEDVDRRRPRRALTVDEIDRLLDSAKARPLFEARTIRVNAGVSEVEQKRLRELGETRAFVYLMAVRTGLRRGELSRVRWCDVDLAKGVVVVPAASAKSKRDQSVELRSDLIPLLKARRGTGAATSLVFDPKTFPNLRTFKKDCELAGIQIKDDQGRTVDFHSLRTTLGSHLAAAGVHPAIAKAILRHSTIELTMKHYTDVRLLDTRGALERLQDTNAGTPEMRIL
jgi:integrase